MIIILLVIINQERMKTSHPASEICNFHTICSSCSPCGASSRKQKIIFGVVYSVLLSLLAVAVYSATTITLHKSEIAPQSPSDLSCPAICPSEYKFQVDADRCCTSEGALSCKTKLQCKDWMLEHDRNYVLVAYAYITLFSCTVLVHLFLCLRSRCEREPQQEGRQKRQVLRWRNRHGLSALEDPLFENETTCEVCLKDAAPRKAITLACCSSLVHPKCLRSWMEDIDNCPACGKIMESLPAK